MAKYVALHDRRLAGSVPGRPNLGIINTDGATPLVNAFHGIRNHARYQRVHSLFILCHGYAGEDARARVSMDAGGNGLMLGREDMLQSNVSMWKAIRDRVANIVVYACAAADTQPGNAGTDADGRYLMGALALHTNANVYAADKIQWYFTGRHRHRGHLDFGDWDGQLLRFEPGSGRPVKVEGPPVELAEVMAGTAA